MAANCSKSYTRIGLELSRGTED